MLTRTAYKMKPPVSARLISGHPLADKLIASYLFNEGSGLTAFDPSGRRHHGTLTGAVTRVIGKYGRAVDLDSFTGHIVIPDHDDFSPVGTPFSISVSCIMHDTSNFMIASKGVLNTDAEWQFYTKATDELRIRFYDESVDTCYIGRESSMALTPYVNKVINLVATYDGGKLSSGIRLYTYGVRIDSTNTQANAGAFIAVENLDHDVWLGRYDAVYADGIICSVMIWRRVLTASDVVKLYADPFCMFARSPRLLVTI